MTASSLAPEDSLDLSLFTPDAKHGSTNDEVDFFGLTEQLDGFDLSTGLGSDLSDSGSEPPSPSTSRSGSTLYNSTRTNLSASSPACVAPSEPDPAGPTPGSPAFGPTSDVDPLAPEEDDLKPALSSSQLCTSQPVQTVVQSKEWNTADDSRLLSELQASADLTVGEVLRILCTFGKEPSSGAHTMINGFLRDAGAGSIDWPKFRGFNPDSDPSSQSIASVPRPVRSTRLPSPKVERLQPAVPETPKSSGETWSSNDLRRLIDLHNRMVEEQGEVDWEHIATFFTNRAAAACKVAYTKAQLKTPRTKAQPRTASRQTARRTATATASAAPAFRQASHSSLFTRSTSSLHQLGPSQSVQLTAPPAGQGAAATLPPAAQTESARGPGANGAEFTAREVALLVEAVGACGDAVNVTEGEWGEIAEWVGRGRLACKIMYARLRDSQGWV